MAENRNRLRSLVAPAAMLMGFGETAQGGAVVIDKPTNRWNQPGDTAGQAQEGVETPVVEAAASRAERVLTGKRESVAKLTIGKPPRAKQA